MNFIINCDEWKIKELSKEELLDLYNKDKTEDEKASYTFGVTVYPEHIIYINKDMCYAQKVKTLIHELTHCFIWNNGLYNAPNYTEEMVCDLVSGVYTFINEVINEYHTQALNQQREEFEQYEQYKEWKQSNK